MARAAMSCLFFVGVLSAPAMARTICGHEIKLKSQVMERASKWFGPDKKAKIALGSFITDCEADGVRYIVSSPDGKPDNRLMQGFIYRKGQ